MREKNYNTGLRGVLFENRHYQRMGAAIWLYGWLVLRQTHQSEGVGWVLGGSPISYREIEEETGFNRRTLESWLRSLRRHGYVETEAAPGGIVVRITKAKKFTQPPRKVTEGVRKFAGGWPQPGVASTQQSVLRQRVADGIGSSSVVREKESEAQREIHIQTQNQSGLWERENQPSDSHPGPQQNRPHYQPQNFSYEARERQRLFRFEREEAIRRELAVGTGPEVRRK
jgi:hypothetical protein